MKSGKTIFFIAVSSVSLVIVLVIQVTWMIETAKIKEALFNEKAGMVLSRTTEALRSDRETCRKIGACARAGDTPGQTVTLGKDERETIDSLLNHFMRLYHFRTGYSFAVAKPGLSSGTAGGPAGNIYNQSLDEGTGAEEIELKLIIPDKKQFILAEMSPLFITSVILILVVLILFWRTTLSLVREKELSEHTTDFLNNMTHEFKTPLTNIALAGRMIHRDPVQHDREKLRHYTGIILEENEKLRLQVEQVLSMSALERGEIPLQKTVLDLHELLRESLRHMELQIGQRGGQVTLEPDSGTTTVSGDRTHLVNAFCNLVDNALKYASGPPVLLVTTLTSATSTTITFADHGIGIAREYQKSVFKRFFRVPTGDVHDVKGFGLGLAYVKKIVELHGGTIGLQSEKGKGTTFTIILPHA